MSTLRAYLGVAGLLDVGYRFYTQNVPAAARQTAGIVDEDEGWYSIANVTLLGDHVRWDSTGTPDAVAREDLAILIALASLSGGGADDPWLTELPGAYEEGTAGAIIGRFNLEPTDAPLVPVIASTDPEQIIGSLVTRDGSGNAISGVPITFQLLAFEGALDSYRTAPFRVVSVSVVVGPDTFVGIIQHPFPRGATYRARRSLFVDSKEDKWVEFTVPTDPLLDSFDLPQILGSA